MGEKFDHSLKDLSSSPSSYLLLSSLELSDTQVYEPYIRALNVSGREDAASPGGGGWQRRWRAVSSDSGRQQESRGLGEFFFFFFIALSLELSDTKVHEP